MGPGGAVSGHKAYFRQSPLEIHFYRTVWPAHELLRSKGEFCCVRGHRADFPFQEEAEAGGQEKWMLVSPHQRTEKGR